MGGGGRFFFLKIMKLRTFVFQFECSPHLSVSPSLQTHLHIFLSSLPLPLPLVECFLPPTACPPPPPRMTSAFLFFPFGSCNTRCYLGEVNLGSLAFQARCRPGPAPAPGGKGLCLGCSVGCFSLSLPQHALPSPPCFLFSFY